MTKGEVNIILETDGIAHCNTLNGEKKKILFVAYFYPPISGTGLPGSQRIVRFVRNMESKDIHVLTLRERAYPDYMEVDTKKERFVKNEHIVRTGVFDYFSIAVKLKASFQKVFKSTGVDVEKKCSQKGDDAIGQKEDASKLSGRGIKDIVSMLLRYPDFASPWLIPAFLRGLRLIKKEKIDVVFATGMPWTSLIVGYLLKLCFKKTKLIVDFRDPWVDNPYIDKGEIEKKVDRTMESMIIRKADLVVANTDMLANEMVKRYPEDSQKIIVLPNGFDALDFQNIPDMTLPDDKLIISHAGFLYLKRDPVALLKAIKISKNLDPDIAAGIQFHHIGKVSLDYDLNSWCRQNGIEEHVVLPGSIPHKECLGYLKKSDLLLLIQPGTKTQVPSKIYEYLYLKKPILAITEKQGALGRLIEQYDFGKVFEPDQYDAIARFLIQMGEKKLVKKESVGAMDYQHIARFDAINICRELERKIQKLYAA